MRDNEKSEVNPQTKAPEAKPQTKAVAVHYEGAGGAGPRVLASGRGAVAEQILRIAFDRGVKVREDADLAEILAALNVDSMIPLEAFAAVAEILSYVYRAERHDAAAPTPGAGPGAQSAPNDKLRAALPPGAPDNKPRAAPAALAARPPGPSGPGAQGAPNDKQRAALPPGG